MPAGLRLVLRLVLAVAAAVLAVSPARSGAAAAPPATPAVITAGGTAVGAVSGAVGYGAPLTGPVVVVRGFQPPANRYGPGHRGVDLASVEGRWVLAAGAGQVSFAGQVAGRGVVVIRHPDGVSTEYEPVAPTVVAGESLRLGQHVGRVHGTHAACRPGTCLHWGARRQQVYFDPLSLLRPLGPVRLVPWSGEPVSR